MTSWSWTRRIDGPRSERLAVVRLLVEAVRAGGIQDVAAASALLTHVSPDMVLGLARFHGVSGLVLTPFRAIEGAPAELIRALRDDYDRGVERHLRVLWEMSRLRTVLEPTGARWAVIKGPVAVERLYRGPGERSYQDLDLLVEPARFERVLAALAADGSEVLDRNWTLLRSDLLGEVHLQLPAGTPLDLHWNLINMNRGRMRVDSPEILGRTITIDASGVALPTLGPEDTIVHLALHAALSGGDKLLWLKDVERAATLLEPRWDLVVERARRWGVAAPTGLILSRAAEVLGAPIPADVPAALIGPRARRLIRRIERVSPWELSVGRLTAATHVVSRTSSLGFLGAAVWFARRAAKRLDPREPRASSVFTSRGDEHDRSAYFADVAASPDGRKPVTKTG